MKGKGFAIALALFALGIAGCSQDDSYSQEQLDAAVKRAEDQARKQAFAEGREKGLEEGELSALKRAGLGGADGWHYVRMDGGRLPASKYLSSGFAIDQAAHLCDFDPSALCFVNPITGENLSPQGGE